MGGEGIEGIIKAQHMNSRIVLLTIILIIGIAIGMFISRTGDVDTSSEEDTSRARFPKAW